MSYGTSDTTVISSTKTEAHNHNATNASVATRDDLSPVTFHTTTPENRRFTRAKRGSLYETLTKISQVKLFLL